MSAIPKNYQRILKRFTRYLLAAGLVLAAEGVVVMRPEQSWREGVSGPMFILSVMLSAWFWGLGPSLLATSLAGWRSCYYFPSLPGEPWFGTDDGLRMAIFLAVSGITGSLIAMRKRAEHALKKNLDELEIRIAERTRELRESNALLRESEERFRLLVDGVADYAIVMLDARGRIASWNPGAQRIFGYTLEQAVGREWGVLYPPEDVSRGKPAADLKEAQELGRREDEGWRVRLDGTRFWANAIITALRYDTGELRGFSQITRDVTELRSLEKSVLDISEREQLRIGHDLHDGVGQELTGIALLAQNLRQRLSHHGLAESAEAGRIAALINGALDQTRQLARGFSPLELGPEGLEPALRDMMAKVQMTVGRPCLVICRNGVHIADDSAALHLYRIAQEAVGNAVRHANAKHIRVELGTIGRSVVLAVYDDGIGMKKARLPTQTGQAVWASA